MAFDRKFGVSCEYEPSGWRLVVRTFRGYLMKAGPPAVHFRRAAEYYHDVWILRTEGHSVSCEHLLREAVGETAKTVLTVTGLTSVYRGWYRWRHPKPDCRHGTKGLIQHSDHGSQYLSIRYTERLAEVGTDASAGSVGDSYDNALAETIIGLYKTEVIRTRGPWRTINDVEYSTLEWVDWFNHRRLLAPISNVPPGEYEQMYYNEVNR